MTALPSMLTTADEEELRAGAADVLDAYATAALAAGCYDGPYGPARAAWQQVEAALGLGKLLLPEAAGGLGLDLRAAAVVAEELGRRVAPLPFVASAVTATTLAVEAGHADLLGALGDGAVAVLTVPLSSAPEERLRPSVVLEHGQLRGSVPMVADALGADLLVVPARDGAELVLATVEVTAPGLTIERVSSLDMTRGVADVHLAGARAGTVHRGDAVSDAVRAALRAGAAVHAAEQLGVAEHAVETTRSYLLQRHQFGRPLGSFQALKHRLVDAWLQVDAMRTASRYAAAAHAVGSGDAWVGTALAQATASDAGPQVAAECLQLHGGIGMTWEHPIHLYLKRAKADQVAYGTARRHRQALAAVAGIRS